LNTSNDNTSYIPLSGALGAFLDRAQRAAGKSDAEMAQALDFARVNVWQAIKAGRIKLPTGKVTGVARALNLPASEVLGELLQDSDPELRTLIDKVWGPQGMTASEKKLLAAWRHLVAGREDEVEPIIMDGKSAIAIVTT
jgi:hypothetical protein